MKLKLVDTNNALCDAWREEFKDTDVQVIHGRFEDVEEYDCMVSPANSFGIMDGGIDLAISRFFPKVQENVQGVIRELYFGLQPVGTSLIIPTEDDIHPWLAHTPTMNVPSDISKTNNVYTAMRAMLLEIYHVNYYQIKIKTILCPGLGAACGCVPVMMSAKQMRMAYRDVIENPISRYDWNSTRNLFIELEKTKL